MSKTLTQQRTRNGWQDVFGLDRTNDFYNYTVIDGQFNIAICTEEQNIGVDGRVTANSRKTKCVNASHRIQNQLESQRFSL